MAITTVEQTLRAGIYTRVSKDKSGVARSPAEQETDARKDCERNGWTVAEVYVDNDLGASRYSRGHRADMDRLKADVAAGQLDVLVAWDASRLQRDLAAYNTLSTLCREHGVLWSYNGRTFDLDDAEDEFSTALDVLLAQREAGVTRKRVRRALAANATEGRVHGRVQFGYRRIYDPHTGRMIGQEADPVTGPIVTEIFRRVAAGESLRSLAAELNARGVTTYSGTTWSGALLGHLLKRESYLGRRTHHGTVTVADAWPALTDERTWHAVQAIRGSRSASQVADHRAKHLLTGIIRCGECGAGMVYDPRSNQRGQNALYRCRERKCVSRTAEIAEAIVEELVIDRLSRPDDALSTADAPRADAQAALDEAGSLRARLAALEDDVAEGRMTGEAFGRIEAKISAQHAEAEARATAASSADVPAVVRALTGKDAAKRWKRLGVEDQRAVVRALLIEPMFIRKRGADLPPNALGLTFRWQCEGELHVV